MSDDFLMPKEPNLELYRAVVASPDDDAPRLVYADWCDANGETARGHFIRLQCRFAPLAETHADWYPLMREIDELADAYSTRWLYGRPRHGGDVAWTFRRGFPDTVGFDSADDLWKHGPKVFRYPVRRLEIDTPVSMSRLAKWPTLGLVRELRLGCLTDDDLLPLARSRHLGQLESLAIFGQQMRQGAVTAMLASDLPALSHLEVAGRSPAVARAVAAALARGSLLGQLRSLTLNDGVGDEGLSTLAAASAGSPLTSLTLRRSRVTAAGLAAVAEAAAWPALRELHVGRTRLGDEGAERLTTAAHWPSLRALSLADCEVGDGGAAALAGATQFRGLTYLGLATNAIADAGARALAASPHLPAVRHLDLRYNQVGEAGARALGRSASLASLRDLRLTNNGVSARLLDAVTDAVRRRDPSALDEPKECGTDRRSVLPLPSSNASPDEAGLRQAVADDPDDDLPLLAYADWYEDNGDPARAQLIRLQLDPNGDEEAARELIAKNAPRWLGGLAKFADRVTFERGLMIVSLGVRKFLSKAFQRDAVALIDLAGASGLRLTGRSRRWDRVAESAALAAMRELRLEYNLGPPDSLRDLLGSPHLAHLHTLHLAEGFDLADLRLPDLGESALPRLRRLRLRRGRPQPDAAALLLAWPRVAALTTLGLNELWVVPSGAAALAESPRLARLHRLDLSQNYSLADAGVAALAASPRLANLTELRLASCAVGEAGARRLAASPHLGRLAVLDLGRNRIGEGGAAALLESSGLAGVRRFVLQECGLGRGFRDEFRRRHAGRVVM